MTKEFSPQRLDVKAFAQAGGHLSGHDSLLKYERLAQEAKGLHPDLLVDWTADGEVRTTHGIGGQVWLRLRVRAAFPMTCQRCLGPVDVPLEVDREFRFVADEATAEALDDESEEDLLALSREFNLRELIEDEAPHGTAARAAARRMSFVRADGLQRRGFRGGQRGQTEPLCCTRLPQDRQARG